MGSQLPIICGNSHLTFHFVGMEQDKPIKPIVKCYTTVPIMALKDRKSFIKAMRTAKRVASGKRAATACAACKKGRARCDDTRPCKRCRTLGICDGCELIEQKSDASDGKIISAVRKIESYQQPLTDKLICPGEYSVVPPHCPDLRFLAPSEPSGIILPNLLAALSRPSQLSQDMKAFVSQSSPFLPSYQLHQSFTYPAFSEQRIPHPATDASPYCSNSAVMQRIYAALDLHQHYPPHHHRFMIPSSLHHHF